MNSSGSTGSCQRSLPSRARRDKKRNSLTRATDRPSPNRARPTSAEKDLSPLSLDTGTLLDKEQEVHRHIKTQWPLYKLVFLFAKEREKEREERSFTLCSVPSGARNAEK